MDFEEHHFRSASEFWDHSALKRLCSPISPSLDHCCEHPRSLLAGCHSFFQPGFADIPVANTERANQMQLQILENLRCFQQAPFIFWHQEPTNHEIAASATGNWTPLTLYFPLSMVLFHVEFWWALQICALGWSKVYKITMRSSKQ